MSEKWQKPVLAVATLYLLGLQLSIAAVEISSWLLILMTLGLLFSGKLNNVRFDWQSLRPELISLMTLLALTLISLLVSPYGPKVIDQAGFMRWVPLLLGLYPVFRILGHKWDAKGAAVLQIAIAFIGAYSIFQFFTGIDIMGHSENPLRPVGSFWKATGTQTMSLTFAVLVAMGSVMCLSRAFTADRFKVWNWLVVVLGSMGVFVSMSRAMWLGYPVVVLLMVFMRRRRLFWPAVGLIAALGLVAIQLFPDLSSRLESVFRPGEDGSMIKRVAIWKGYWAIFQDHPWLGVGLFQGKSLLPEYFTKLSINSEFFSHAHSNLLQWLAGSGIFAALAYVFVSMRLLWRAWLIRGTWLGLGLLMAQLVFHIGGLTDCTFFDGEVNHLIVFVWALTLARRL